MLNLIKDVKILRVSDAVAAGTTTLTTSVVDTQGFESVAFIAVLGDVTDTSVLTLTGKTNSADSTSGASALSKTVSFTADATSADDNMLILDLNKPRDRYAFATLDRATANAAVDGIFALLYNAQERPVTQDTAVIASAFVNDPAAA